MGLALRFLGRLLFVILFVGAGIQKVQTPEKSAPYLSASYKIFHSWVQTTQVFKQSSEVVSPYIEQHIPLIKQFTSPEFVNDNAVQIITYVGYTQLVSSALVLIGFSLAGFVLYLFTISTIVIIHNPFANPSNFHSEFLNAIVNLAIAGIALFIAADIRPRVYENVHEASEATAKKVQKEKVENSGSKKPSQAASVSKPADKKRK